MNFNLDHPERLEGEVCLGNTTADHLRDYGWKTKRIGRQAYQIDGIPIASSPSRFAREWHPIFVQLSEMNAAGVMPMAYPTIVGTDTTAIGVSLSARRSGSSLAAET